MKRRIKKFGWVRGNPSPRDHWAETPRMFAAKQLPKSYDMRKQFPPCYDQGNLGSCTGNAAVGVYQFTDIEQKGTGDMLSVLFEYYNTRVIQGTPNEDSGATIRDAFKALNKFGLCTAKEWPYKVTKFDQKPPASCYKSAEKRKILKYERVEQTAYAINSQLAANNPIAFGFTVFESFESDEVARKGILYMPDLQTESEIGGHAVVIVGYDIGAYNGKGGYIIRNSWGTEWGLNGYFWMPAQMLLDPNYCSDFWTASVVGAEPLKKKKA